MGQEGEQGRRIGRGAGRDDEKDIRHRGIEQRARFLERARDENFGAGSLERAPNGLRHLAARAKEKEGPHVRGYLARTVRARPPGVKRAAELSYGSILTATVFVDMWTSMPPPLTNIALLDPNLLAM